MKVQALPTKLEGVTIFEVQAFSDERGFFYEVWNARDFAAAGLGVTFVQENHSHSVRGVLRGIHYQDATVPLGKLVRCTAGAVLDVAVDLRLGSPTFGQWVGVELTRENRRQLYVPPGFGHAFQALTEGAEFQYKQTCVYTPSAEGVIAWDDPDIGIDWPIRPPSLSPRDRNGASLKQYAQRPAFRYSAESPLTWV